MDVPGYVNPDDLMNVPIGCVCQTAPPRPPQQLGTQGVAEQTHVASMQTGQDRQQNKEPFATGKSNDNAMSMHQGSSP